MNTEAGMVLVWGCGYIAEAIAPWFGVAIAGFASGFGQFGVVAALGDEAQGFGQAAHRATLGDHAGRPGTNLGIGLAIMRLASLGGLPITGLADVG